MGKTRSCGRILGILEINSGSEGGRWKTSRPLAVSLDCLDMLIVGDDDEAYSGNET